MQFTTPNSFGSRLREYNPCHDPRSGRFATRRAGRCAQDAETERRIVVDALRTRPDARLAVNGSTRGIAVADVSKARRALRRARGEDAPGYMQADIAKAAKDHRVTTAWGTDAARSIGLTGFLSGGLSRRSLRDVSILPDILDTQGPQFDSRHEKLSVYRHEVGHVDPAPLTKTPVVGGVPLDAMAGKAFLRITTDPNWSRTQKAQMLGHLQQATDTMKEEIRAWRNAVRNHRGRIDYETAYMGLQSYAKHLAKVYTDDPVEIERHASTVARRVVDTLRRYGRRVRRG